MYNDTKERDKKNNEENKRIRGSESPNDESGVVRVLESSFFYFNISFQRVVSMNARKARAKAIMEMDYHFSQSAQDKFKVRSQTDPDKYYNVIGTADKGLVCECLDHQTRKADCKHIKVVLARLMANTGFANTPFRIMERANFDLCKFCDSGNIKKSGIRKNKNGTVQRYTCLDCKKRFGTNFGFENRQYDQRTITQALLMYHNGMSVRKISQTYAQMGIDVAHTTIYYWVSEYAHMIHEYVSKIVPRTKSRFMVRADEVYIKVRGHKDYLFASMEDDSRYWLASDMAKTKEKHNADKLLQDTKKQVGRTPAHFTTDGLPAYEKSSRKVFGRKTQHHRHIHLKGDMNNNKMERLNGTIRAREIGYRGLKKTDTQLINGLKIHYNFAKPHEGLDGKTPAQAVLIEVDGQNTLKTLIENARLYAISK